MGRSFLQSAFSSALSSPPSPSPSSSSISISSSSVVGDDEIDVVVVEEDEDNFSSVFPSKGANSLFVRLIMPEPAPCNGGDGDDQNQCNGTSRRGAGVLALSSACTGEAEIWVQVTLCAELRCCRWCCDTDGNDRRCLLFVILRLPKVAYSVQHINNTSARPKGIATAACQGTW